MGGWINRVKIFINKRFLVKYVVLINNEVNRRYKKSNVLRQWRVQKSWTNPIHIRIFLKHSKQSISQRYIHILLKVRISETNRDVVDMFSFIFWLIAKPLNLNIITSKPKLSPEPFYYIEILKCWSVEFNQLKIKLIIW